MKQSTWITLGVVAAAGYLLYNLTKTSPKPSAYTSSVGGTTLSPYDANVLNTNIGNNASTQVNSILQNATSTGDALNKLRSNVNTPNAPNYIPVNTVTGGNNSVNDWFNQQIAANAIRNPSPPPTPTSLNAWSAVAVAKADPYFTSQTENPFANIRSVPTTVNGIYIPDFANATRLQIAWDNAKAGFNH